MSGSAGRKRGNWSAQELERLRLLYPRSGENHVATLLRRSPASVRRRAHGLFRRGVRRGAWTAEEDAQLRRGFGVLDARALAMVLARSERDVRERAAQLRSIRRRGTWSAEEEALLKQLYGSRSDQDLEVCLSRSAAQIGKAAARLCLRKDKRFLARAGGTEARRTMPRWSEAEIQRLAMLYPTRDNLDVARQLRRSVASVANKASQLGLRKDERLLSLTGKRNVQARYRRTQS